MKTYENSCLKLQIICLRYSPLHNVPTGSPTLQFPSLLVITGDHDDRVVPHHSYKYMATVQDKLGATNRNPLLLKIDRNAGHAGSDPTVENKVNKNLLFLYKQ